jgi:hypothetical protein
VSLASQYLFLSAYRIASRAGVSFRHQADEFIIHKHAVVIQGAARQFISRQKMTARSRDIAGQINYALARRITPHVRGACFWLLLQNFCFMCLFQGISQGWL